MIIALISNFSDMLVEDSDKPKVYFRLWTQGYIIVLNYHLHS